MSDHSQEPQDHIAALLQAREAIDRALTALGAAGAASGDAVEAIQVAPEPRWISLEQAAPIRGVTRQTMALHAERFGLGTFTERRWRIDENRLRALNDGRPYQKLNPFPDGDT
jgi:hypothetical protein